MSVKVWGGPQDKPVLGLPPLLHPRHIGTRETVLIVPGGVSGGKSAASVRHYRKRLSLPSLLAAGAVGPSPGLILPLRTSPLPLTTAVPGSSPLGSAAEGPAQSRGGRNER